MKKLIFAATLALATFAASAQHTFGNIVVDAEAGDKVSIYSPDVGLKRERTVKKTGTLQFPRLPLGLYVVTITKPDGTSRESTLRLHAGRTEMPRQNGDGLENQMRDDHAAQRAEPMDSSPVDGT
jgi:hypothetical protein